MDAGFVFSFFFLGISSYCFAQKSFFTPNRSYKVEGYILLGADTVQGYIAIPIDRDEVDYGSLTKQVTFIDSADKSKKYKPSNLNGFGIKGDDVISNYISVAKSENSLRNIFLKKVVEEEAMLLVEKIDRAAGYATTTFYGMGSSQIYEKEINKSVYYLKIGTDALVKVPFDNKTASIRKRDVKKLLINLPESFADSDEQIDFSSFIILLESYNAKTISTSDK